MAPKKPLTACVALLGADEGDRLKSQKAVIEVLGRVRPGQRQLTPYSANRAFFDKQEQEHGFDQIVHVAYKAMGLPSPTQAAPTVLSRKDAADTQGTFNTQMNDLKFIVCSPGFLTDLFAKHGGQTDVLNAAIKNRTPLTGKELLAMCGKKNLMFMRPTEWCHVPPIAPTAIASHETVQVDCAALFDDDVRNGGTSIKKLTTEEGAQCIVRVPHGNSEHIQHTDETELEIAFTAVRLMTSHADPVDLISVEDAIMKLADHREALQEWLERMSLPTSPPNYIERLRAFVTEVNDGMADADGLALHYEDNHMVTDYWGDIVRLRLQAVQLVMNAHGIGEDKCKISLASDLQKGARLPADTINCSVTPTDDLPVPGLYFDALVATRLVMKKTTYTALTPGARGIWYYLHRQSMIMAEDALPVPNTLSDSIKMLSELTWLAVLVATDPAYHFTKAMLVRVVTLHLECRESSCVLYPVFRYEELPRRVRDRGTPAKLDAEAIEHLRLAKLAFGETAMPFDKRLWAALLDGATYGTLRLFSIAPGPRGHIANERHMSIAACKHTPIGQAAFYFWRNLNFTPSPERVNDDIWNAVQSRNLRCHVPEEDRLVQVLTQCTSDAFYANPELLGFNQVRLPVISDSKLSYCDRVPRAELAAAIGDVEVKLPGAKDGATHLCHSAIIDDPTDVSTFTFVARLSRDAKNADLKALHQTLSPKQREDATREAQRIVANRKSIRSPLFPDESSISITYAGGTCLINGKTQAEFEQGSKHEYDIHPDPEWYWQGRTIHTGWNYTETVTNRVWMLEAFHCRGGGMVENWAAIIRDICQRLPGTARRLMGRLTTARVNVEFPRPNRDGEKAADRPPATSKDVEEYDMLLLFRRLVPCALEPTSPYSFKITDAHRVHGSDSIVSTMRSALETPSDKENGWRAYTGQLETIKATLTPYQDDAVRFMTKRRDRGRANQAVVMGTGTGKTLTCLAYTLDTLMQMPGAPTRIIWTVPDDRHSHLSESIRKQVSKWSLPCTIVNMTGGRTLKSQLNDYGVIIIKRDHMHRAEQDGLEDIAASSVCVVDEFDKYCRVGTQGSHVTLRFAQMARMTVIMSATPYTSHIKDMLPSWVQLVAQTYTVTPDNIDFAFHEAAYWCDIDMGIDIKHDVELVAYRHMPERIEALQRKDWGTVCGMEQDYVDNEMCEYAIRSLHERRTERGMRHRQVIMVAEGTRHIDRLIELCNRKIGEYDVRFTAGTIQDARRDGSSVGIIIVSHRNNRGWNDGINCDEIIKSPYWGNSADRIQMDGRLRRIGQTAKTVRTVTFMMDHGAKQIFHARYNRQDFKNRASTKDMGSSFTVEDIAKLLHGNEAHADAAVPMDVDDEQQKVYYCTKVRARAPMQETTDSTKPGQPLQRFPALPPMIPAQAPVPGDAQLHADAAYLAIEQSNGEDAQDSISVAATCGGDPLIRTVSRSSRAPIRAQQQAPVMAQQQQAAAEAASQKAAAAEAASQKAAAEAASQMAAAETASQKAAAEAASQKVAVANAEAASKKAAAAEAASKKAAAEAASQKAAAEAASQKAAAAEAASQKAAAEAESQMAAAVTASKKAAAAKAASQKAAAKAASQKAKAQAQVAQAPASVRAHAPIIRPKRPNDAEQEPSPDRKRLRADAPTIRPKRPNDAEQGPSPGRKRLRRPVLLSSDEEDEDLECP